MSIRDEDVVASLLGERVYQGVKAYVMSTGQLGRRLDLVLLADEQNASLTPVRAALHRLTGEGLVEAHPHEGFRIPSLTLSGLRDLYDWNRRLLLQAVPASLAPGRLTSLGSAPMLDGPAELQAARLFRAIAALLGNRECARAVEGLNDRLHRIRLIELNLLDDTPDEVRCMAERLRQGDVVGLREMLQTYHRRRLKHAVEIISFAERMG